MENRKEGFSAYEEIKQLAFRAFHPDIVTVQAAVFGNDYEVIEEGTGKVLLSGTSQHVRAELEKKLKGETL